MREVTLREANQFFSSCIAEVEAGERLVLLRRGKPVAEIIPYTGKKNDPTKDAARKKLLALMDGGLDLGGKPFSYEERHAR
jgi:antitoxin (DNA-binding transcriptional repressor) of toxin-antitoxin stability system